MSRSSSAASRPTSWRRGNDVGDVRLSPYRRRRAPRGFGAAYGPGRPMARFVANQLIIWVVTGARRPARHRPRRGRARAREVATARPLAFTAGPDRRRADALYRLLILGRRAAGRASLWATTKYAGQGRRPGRRRPRALSSIQGRRAHASVIAPCQHAVELGSARRVGLDSAHRSAAREGTVSDGEGNVDAACIIPVQATSQDVRGGLRGRGSHGSARARGSGRRGPSAVAGGRGGRDRGERARPVRPQRHGDACDAVHAGPAPGPPATTSLRPR